MNRFVQKRFFFNIAPKLIKQNQVRPLTSKSTNTILSKKIGQLDEISHENRIFTFDRQKMIFDELQDLKKLIHENKKSSNVEKLAGTLNQVVWGGLIGTVLGYSIIGGYVIYKHFN